MKRLRVVTVWTWLAMAAVLSSCGTLSRSPAGGIRLAPDSVIPVQDPCAVASDSAAIGALRRELIASGEAGSAPILALSGGGANGAYGAGVLVGWTQTGERPVFKIVTGVSTGALTAPFAFLGARWNPQLQAAYANGEAKDILGWRQLATFALPSLYSASALKRLVDRAMSPPMVIDRLFGRLFAYISDHRDALEILHESETELARTFQDTLERVLCLRLGEAAGVSVSPVFYAVAYGTVLHATKALPGQYGQIIGALPEVLSAYLITLTAQPSPTER